MLRTGQALILAVKPFGERDALAELFCTEFGRIRGLVKGGNTKKLSPTVQPFNTVNYEHFRRLDGQLGTLTLELSKSRAHIWLSAKSGSFLVPYLSQLLTQLLPEEHPYENLATRTTNLLEGPATWQDSVAYEIFLLETIGYGLRLRPEEAVECPENSALAYVSPASGRAVPINVARGYESRLLPLPHSLGGPECSEFNDFTAAWNLTGHFIEKIMRDATRHSGTLESRARLAAYYARAHNFAPNVTLIQSTQNQPDVLAA
ncbi:MAG: DNA repair protein RecO [Pseudomonas fluorescens]|nr:MAG: DNA repair protein RecO [Pseudomonas fluorescens]